MRLKIVSIQVWRYVLLGCLFCPSVRSVANDTEVWEKRLSPDLIYIMEYEKNLPRVIHTVKFRETSPHLEMKPALTGKTIFSAETPLKELPVRSPDDFCPGRETLSQLVEREGAIAGITGDFFTTLGVAVGTMVRDGELVTPACFKPHGVLGWAPGIFEMNVTKWLGSMRPEGGEVIPLQQFNKPCPANAVSLCTAVAGYSYAEAPSYYVVLRTDDKPWEPNHSRKATVSHFYRDAGSVYVLPGNIVLAARGDAIKHLEELKPGQEVDLTTNVEGFKWGNVKHALSGGPYLLRDGKVIVDTEAQGFTNKTFTPNRYARVAIGRTKDGWICMTVVDGPSSLAHLKGSSNADYSVGASLYELADIMKSLGCEDAMNLDGGGSSTLVLNSRCLNRPTYLQERRLANALLLFGDIRFPKGSREGMNIYGPVKLKVGETVPFKLAYGIQNNVPNEEIIWSFDGASWIDQGGNFHAIYPGETTLYAWHRGNFFSQKVLVEREPESKIESAD